MGGQQFAVFDWSRVLMEQDPWRFLLEVAFRVLCLYALIIVAMRLKAKKMGPTFSRNGMAALVSLAATIGIPMQSSTRGLLPALVVVIVIVGTDRLVAMYSTRNRKFEEMVLGNIAILVKDGCLQMTAIRDATLSRGLVVAQLRSQGLDHLGKVKRLYLEAEGIFTMQSFDDPRPGLTLFPHYDTEMIERQRRIEDHFACGNCGHVETPHPAGRCARCGADDWTAAVLSS